MPVKSRVPPWPVKTYKYQTSLRRSDSGVAPSRVSQTSIVRTTLRVDLAWASVSNFAWSANTFRLGAPSAGTAGRCPYAACTAAIACS